MIERLYEDRVAALDQLWLSECDVPAGPRVGPGGPGPLKRWLPLPPGADDALRASLADVGLLQNVIVLPVPDGRLLVLAGRRRVDAARALGWTWISVKVIPRVPGESMLRLTKIAAMEDLRRRQFTGDEIRGAEHALRTLEEEERGDG
jgi:hypothetical protein